MSVTFSVPLPCNEPLVKLMAEMLDADPPLKFTAPAEMLTGINDDTGVFSVTVPPAKVALPDPARFKDAAANVMPLLNAIFCDVPPVVKLKLSSAVLPAKVATESTVMPPLPVASDMVCPTPVSLRIYLLVERFPLA